MSRTPCCEKVGLKKGPWTREEDHKLLAFIDAHGHGSWRALPSKAGLQRCGKSCRLRWTNYLRPDIKRGKFNVQEEQTIILLHALLGNRWSAIATHLPKRTDNEIKNYWNMAVRSLGARSKSTARTLVNFGHIPQIYIRPLLRGRQWVVQDIVWCKPGYLDNQKKKKKKKNYWNTHIKKMLTKMGIDPITHKRRTTALGSNQAKNVANLSHMAQWENARLEAEARLVRKAKLVVNPNQIIQQQNSSAQLVCRPTHLPLMRPGPHCPDVLKAWQGIMLDKAFHGANCTLESPTSTINFSENLPNIVPAVGFIPNQTLAMANYDQCMIMKQNESKIFEPIEEKMENLIELHEMSYTNDIYPINCIMEGLTDLVDSANGHNLNDNNSAVDFEENWNNILNNLANSSPLGLPVF